MTETARLPLVTVVTPSYNQGRFIEETIISVLSQDYPHIEYLIIDGGSTDDTLEILRKYEDQLAWISEPDLGQSHAINKGFKMSSGEIICWLNSDDTFEPGAIERVVCYMNTHADVMMVSGGVNTIDEVGQILETKSATIPFDLWSVVYLAQNIHQPATFFRKCIFDVIDLLDESLNWCMDSELWIRIGSRFRVECVAEIFANDRMHSATKTSSGGYKRWLEIVSVQKKYANWVFPFGLLRASFGSIHMVIKYNYPFLYRYLKTLIYHVKNGALDDYYRNVHGVYPDQWLGRKARFMFRMEPEYSAINMIFDLPDDKRLLPNQLQVRVGGKFFTAILMSMPGKYEVKIPYDRKAVKPPEIELKFSKALPVDDHRRRLACKLEGVTYAFSQ